MIKNLHEIAEMFDISSLRVDQLHNHLAQLLSIGQLSEYEEIVTMITKIIIKKNHDDQPAWCELLTLCASRRTRRAFPFSRRSTQRPVTGLTRLKDSILCVSQTIFVCFLI